MLTKRILVTPEQAGRWLEESNTHNRVIRPGVVKRYAEAMAAGKWLDTHQGIAFDDRGVLVDGQHRLLAVVRAGVAVWMNITYGVPLENQIVVDDPAVRSQADAIKLAGHADLTNGHVAVARRMKDGAAVGPKPDKQDMRDFIDKYFDGIDFAVRCFPTRARSLTPAPVLAAVGRAFYHVDGDGRARLRRFAEVLLNGLMEPGDEAAVLLRNWLLSRDGGFGGAMQGLIFQKATRAAKAFLDGERMTKLYTTKGDLFPLPENPLPTLRPLPPAFPDANGPAAAAPAAQPGA
jgi:hypothetical protein